MRRQGGDVIIRKSYGFSRCPDLIAESSCFIGAQVLHGEYGVEVIFWDSKSAEINATLTIDH